METNKCNEIYTLIDSNGGRKTGGKLSDHIPDTWKETLMPCLHDGADYR